MSHFDISEWTDFARGLLSLERRAVLESHLAAGCADCASTCRLLGKVVTASAADKNWAVPTELVAAAGAIFAAQQSIRPPLLERIVARLVCDSLGELQPLGARAAHTATRQVAFEAGDYHIDLSLDRNSARVSLLGQFASSKDPVAPLQGVPVLLMAGKHVAGRAVTNEFGEFSLEFRPRKNLRLCLPLAAEGAQIDIPLEELR